MEEDSRDAEQMAVRANERTKPRGYQIEIFQKAVEENVILYLETGAGKTLIAIMLIEEFLKRIKKPSKNVCVFLAHTIPLVEQQADAIEKELNIKVGRYHGERATSSKTHEEWEKRMEKHEVLVMTPDILLHNLHHCFMKMEWIDLIIIDECHHAQKRHSYAQLMREFYKKEDQNRPRIFGMTGSPIIGKGGQTQVEYAKGIASLEQLLDAKICTVSERWELELHVPMPGMEIGYYENLCLLSYEPISTSLDKLSECLSECNELVNNCFHSRNMDSSNVEFSECKRIIKRVKRLHGDLYYCLVEIGLLGAKQAANILIQDMQEGNQEDEELDNVGKSIAISFLKKSCSIFDDYVGGGVEYNYKEPFFSSRVLALLQILSDQRDGSSMRCIVFVTRIIASRVLSKLINHCLSSTWHSESLTGLKEMSRGSMKETVHRFRANEVNLLVATSVAEEGLDIQACSLVIRFDHPSGVCGFIQSRGRARMMESKYIFLVESGNVSQESLVQHLIHGEKEMKREVNDKTGEIEEVFEEEEDDVYRVGATDATISTACSITSLNNYCAKLPREESGGPIPEYFFFDDPDGIKCHIHLPSNAPIQQVIGPPCVSKVKAKRTAALEACKILHQMGAYNDFLLPPRDDSDTDSDESRLAKDLTVHDSMEIHDMLVPDLLQGRWTTGIHSVCLKIYLLKFFPVPPDREYTQFALFLEGTLPREAEKMKAELHLAQSRIVKTELFPAGSIELESVQLKNAMKFQEIYLKVMLDRELFLKPYVEVPGEGISACSPTSYMLLPVQVNSFEDKIHVDWNMISKCLCSPVLITESCLCESNSYENSNWLRFRNGSFHIDDIRNSVIITPHHHNSFYCILDILPEVNAKSEMPSKCCSYEEHYKNRYNIILKYPEQAMLKAKGLLCLQNLLHPRANNMSQEARNRGDYKEQFVELPPELCILKLKSFSSPLASAVSLLPSLMHRLESLLLAIELKQRLSAAFHEGCQVTVDRLLEAITTEKCSEGFSLERLEVLGDAYLKFAASMHVFVKNSEDDEGCLTRLRTALIRNSNLYKKGIAKGIQVYIRDEYFDPKNFYAVGRPCRNICTSQSINGIHSSKTSCPEVESNACIRCSRQHRQLHRKTIADVVESLIGACLVDGGHKAALAFLNWIDIKLDVDSALLAACLVTKTNLFPASCIDLDALQKRIGHNFMHKELLLQAFIHPSYNDKIGCCYQRLEFLGDAALDYIITSYLYSVYPDLGPGDLTDMRSMTVNNEAFASVAVRHGLHLYIIHKSNRMSIGVQRYASFLGIPKKDDFEATCPKVLGDIVESLAGALLVDTSFDLKYVWNLMLNLLEPIVTPETLRLQPDRELVEVCSYHKLTLKYCREQHDRKYFVEAKVSGKGPDRKELDVGGCGIKTSLKVAKKLAAQDTLLQLKNQYGLEHRLRSLSKLIGGFNRRDPILIGSFEKDPVTRAQLLDDIQEQASGSTEEFGESIYSLTEDFQKFSSKSSIQIQKGVIDSRSSDEEQIEEYATEGQQNHAAEEHQQKHDEAGNFEIVKYDRTVDEGQYESWSARNFLHDFCQKEGLTSPSWVCCKEEGKPHEKRFTFNVSLEHPNWGTVESEGDPCSTKKEAMESAARGLRWWLHSQGPLKH